MNSSLSNLKEWYDIAEWSIFHGYREISTKALTEIMARGGTIGRNTLLEKRLSFDGYLYSIQCNDDDIFSKLSDSLKYLDELHTSFSKDCKSESTNEFRWLRIRLMTIMQLGILTLKEYLHLDSASIILTKPGDITIPRSFQFTNYKTDLEKIFIQHKKYPNSNILSKFEEQAAESYLDILLKPFLSQSTSIKIKQSIFCLFIFHPIEAFRNEASLFAKTVEKEVLPPPGHFVPYLESQIPPEAIWNEKQRENNGPYVENEIQNIETPHSPQTTQLSQLSQPQSQQRPQQKQQQQQQQQDLHQEPQQQPSNESIVDGNETDEQSISESHTKEINTSENEMLNNPLNNLKMTKNRFLTNASINDPILDVTGISNQKQVISVAGRTKPRNLKKKRQSTGTMNSKKRLIDGRSSASEVAWTDSEQDNNQVENENNDDEYEYDDSNKLTIEKIQKRKFEPQLAQQANSNSSGLLTSPGQSVIERDKGVRLAWTKDEEDALIAGVSIHGAGNWVEILQDPNLNYRFRGRTNVNLKDKYRNMIH